MPAAAPSHPPLPAGAQDVMASMLAGMGGMAGLQQMMGGGGMGGMPAFNPEGAMGEDDDDDGACRAQRSAGPLPALAAACCWIRDEARCGCGLAPQPVAQSALPFRSLCLIHFTSSALAGRDI